MAGFTPLQFGVVDGIYRGATALVRLAGGFAADRWRRHKEIASAATGSRPRASSRSARAGPRRRSAPSCARPDRQGHPHGAARCADLAHPTRERWARRSACTARWTRPGRCSARWSPSASWRWRRSRSTPSSSCRSASPWSGSACSCCSCRRARAQAVGRPSPGLREMARLLAQPRFRGLVAAAMLLGVTTISDAFLYLALQRHLDLPARVPAAVRGRRGRVHAARRAAGAARRPRRPRAGLPRRLRALLPVYASLLLPAGGAVALAVCLMLVGASYAATDGVLAALGSACCPRSCAPAGWP